MSKRLFETHCNIYLEFGQNLKTAHFIAFLKISSIQNFRRSDAVKERCLREGVYVVFEGEGRHYGCEEDFKGRNWRELLFAEIYTPW